MRYSIQAFNKMFGWVDYSFYWSLTTLTEAIERKKNLEDSCEAQGLSRQFRIKLFTSEKC